MKLETISVDLPPEIIEILKTQAEKHDLSLEAYVTEVMVRGALKTITVFAEDFYTDKEEQKTKGGVSAEQAEKNIRKHFGVLPKTEETDTSSPSDVESI